MDIYNYVTNNYPGVMSYEVSEMFKLYANIYKICFPYDIYKYLDKRLGEDSEYTEEESTQYLYCTLALTEEIRSKLSMPISNRGVSATTVFVLESQILYSYENGKWFAIAKYNNGYNIDNNYISYKQDIAQSIEEKMNKVKIPFSILADAALILGTKASSSNVEYKDYIKSHGDFYHWSGDRFSYNTSRDNGDIILNNVYDIFNYDDDRFLTMNDVHTSTYNSTDLFDEALDTNGLIRYSYISSLISDFLSKIATINTNISELMTRVSTAENNISLLQK